jgi:hypothetical protein
MRARRSTTVSMHTVWRGEIAPSAQAFITASAAAVTSSALLTGGSSSSSGLSVPINAIRSMHRRMAVGSPDWARATISLTVSCAVTASTSSTAMVFLLREPGGRPAGLPLCPGAKRMATLLL